ncbi:hypothetical protein JL720_16198 [Aureococcus anophagefferens]|nr:hypothetical protein JL720_16198 [Aureococcus anophagefferens]
MAQPLEATQPLLPWRRRPAAQRSEERVARLRWLGAFVGVGALATIALAAAGGATPPDATPRLAAAVAAKTCETSSVCASSAGFFASLCGGACGGDRPWARRSTATCPALRGGGRALDWAPAVDVAPGVTELAWRARSAERGGGAVAIEEHYLDGDSPLLSQTFQKQAYAYWRFALNGDVQTGPSVEATTRVYATRAAFFAALERKRLSAGSSTRTGAAPLVARGLEGLDDPARDRGPQHGPRGFAADARALTAAPAAGLEARPFLFDCGLTVTPGSRRAGGVASLKAGGADELQGLARAAGRRARFSSSATGTAPEPTTYGFDTGAGALAATAPRSSPWPRGRHVVVGPRRRGAAPRRDPRRRRDVRERRGQRQGCAGGQVLARGEAGFASGRPSSSSTTGTASRTRSAASARRTTPR